MLFEIFQTVFKFALLGHTKHPHARRAEAELPLVDARRGIPLDLIALCKYFSLANAVVSVHAL